MSGQDAAQTGNCRTALIHDMVARCVASLLVLAVLELLSFLVLRHQADFAGQDSRLVNLAGRQRMLVSQAAHEAERLLNWNETAGPGDAECLKGLIRQLEDVHLAFLRGDVERQIPPPSSTVQAVFLHEPCQLHARMQTYLSTLKAVALNFKSEQYARIAARLQIRELAVAPWQPHALKVATLPTANATHTREIAPPWDANTTTPVPGLGGLDVMVRQLQRESEQRLASLEFTAAVLLAMTAATLASTAFCVFLPMIRQVRSETSQLQATKAAADARAHQLEEAVQELEKVRDEDSRRTTAMLNIMDDLRRERWQLQKEASVRERTEKQFRSVVEAAPNAMIMIDRAGNIALVNKAAEAIFQYERHELIGQPIELLIPHRFRADHPQCRNKFFQQPRTTLIGQGRELFGRRKDGAEFVVEIGLNPIETDDGMCVLSSVVDMTAHKQAHESTAQLAAIVESSHDAIIGLDLDGTIKSWNRGAEETYQFTACEAVGEHISFVLPTSHSDEAQEIVDRVVRGQLVSNLETVGRRRDGALIDVALSASPVTDKSNVIVGAASITRDITQRKRADERLKQYALDLEKSNQELEQFAYVASHDLKEPLRMVGSYTNLLAEEYGDKLDAEAQKYIKYATDGARRMSALIDDLLNYSRVGRMDAPFETTYLDDVLRQVIDDLRACIQESNARIEVVRKLPAVTGSPTRLRQLFQNLIGNGLKFRHPDRPPVVRISCQQRANMWEVSVQDNGIGIETEFHDRIFQVFQRLHTVDEYPGTGIGLAVCKKIVEQHGGEIRVHSAPTCGTVFRFTLPVKDENDDRKDESSMSEVQQELCPA